MFKIDPYQLLQQWGYIAVFLGAMVEGESVLLTASALAAAGYLSIFKIAILSFVATVLADQGLFFLGYIYGEKALVWIQAKFPKVSPYLKKALGFLEKYQTAYILVFRFIYGVRIISPVIMGAQKISVQKFSFLNVVAAVIWTIVSCSVGYFLGEVVIQLIHQYGYMILIALFMLIVSGIIIFKIWKRKK